MQITKPGPLGLSFRPIEYRKRFGLCVSGYLHVPFAQGAQGTLWGEQSMWTFLAQEMAQPLIDEGVAKVTPEFLVQGRAYAPAGQERACAVRARLGPVEKTLLVFGERHWEGVDRASAPQPFESMPLDWGRAYGGPDFPQNPLGRGRASTGGVQWLPNLELPGQRLLRADQLVAPAGFGALEPAHPQRRALQGTYDADYLKLHSPGFPPDMDWNCFNLAPRDQWLPGSLAGDEPFVLEHLHPRKPRIEGRLPALRVRVFAEYGGLAVAGEGESAPGKLREVPLRLTTVWFFAHAERMVLVFHGLAETQEDDASDIAALLGAVERQGAPKDDAHYLDVLGRRREAQYGAVESLNDGDLLPPGLDTTDPDLERAQALFAVEGLQAQAQRRRAETEVMGLRQKLLAQGRDPDALGVRMPAPEPQPKPAELAAYLKGKGKEIEDQQWQQVDSLLAHLERMMEMVRKGELTPEQLQQMQHRGPPAYRADEHWKQLHAASPGLDAQTLRPQLAMKEVVERVNYLQGAHEQPPAFARAPERARSEREELQWMLAHGLRAFVGLDFTGADLSGLDLRGADFSGAWLESANLAGTNISGAKFAYAVLAHADLRGVIAIETDFTGANLGRALLEKSVLERATLTGAMLMYCAFAHTQWRGADLSGANWLESSWGTADWGAVRAPEGLFHKLDLQGMVFKEAQLTGAVFIECNLSGVDLRAADLQGANFITCTLDGARMESARLGGAVFSLGCSLRGARLAQAELGGTNLSEADLEEASLVGARLDAACLVSSRLAGADLRLASLQGALMRRARLPRARLAGANLKDAILQHADLRGSDLRDANLFGADLSRVKLDADVQLDRALLQRARTWPRLTAEEAAR